MKTVTKKRLPKYSLESWIDPRIEIRQSLIHGKGMFANKAISHGKVVMIWGGTIYTTEEVKSGKTRRDNMANIDWDLYLSDLAGTPEPADKFTNHSCDSNLWMKDEVTLIARRDIKPGEEITIDYALFSTGMSYGRFKCRCGSNFCRGEITQDDWLLPELQARYKNHFSPYINRQIKQNFTQDETF